MRTVRLLIWIAIAGIASCLIFATLLETRGVGFFNQEIVVESDKPVLRVSYCCWNINDEIRRRAEQTADPHLFDWEEAKSVAPNRFLARPMFEDRDRFFKYEVFHPNQLAVLVEFADGTKACRVFDLPKGADVPAVVVTVP